MGGAVAVPEGGGRGRGRKRSLDAMVNVVPAIDLLSCCITFLLVTAVWTQISRLQTTQYGNGAPAAAQAGKVSITLRLGASGHVLETSDGRTLAVAPLGRGAEGEPRYDWPGLEAKLAELRAAYPDQTALTLAAEDAVRYADLVQTIDACVGAGLANVAVTGHAG
jgi:biopolymer transport protein ExbD